MSSVVNWIETARFFGRPLFFKRQTNVTCEEAALSPAFQSSFASCREQAAGDCATAGAETSNGDACVCSTLDDYDQAFSQCIFDTPFSDCIDPNNAGSVSDWSSGHCTESTTPTPTTTPDPSTTTTPTTSPSTTTEPETTSSTSTSSSTSTTETTSTSESSTEPPESSDPPSTSTPPSSSTPEQSSSSTSPTGTSSEKSSTTPMSTPSSVPEPSMVPITVASRVTARASGGASPSSSSAHSNLPRYTGSGNLLQGYCITPTYTLLEGATAYWAPVIGCIKDRPDCCPFDIPTSTTAVSATGSIPPTVTLTIPQPGVTTSAVSGNNGGFPSALLPAQATLERCPDDYFSISDGCCPSNYFPWSTAFGGQTPCYSTLPTVMTPPPIPDSLISAGPTSAAPPKTTSAIINVVYAMQYPVKSTSKPALATNTKIGIGAGAGGAALVLGALVGLLIWKHRAHKRDKDTLKSLSGIGSTRQSVAASSAVGGVSEWRKNIPGSPTGGRFYEGLEPLPEPQPTLPNVGMIQQRYPADWRPGQRTISPPLPGSFVHNSIPSPPIPEGYSEADSQQAVLSHRYSNNSTPGVRSDGGFPSGSRSELQGGEYIPLQELQGVPEEQQWVQHGGNGYQAGAGEQWNGQQGGQQVRYYEAPAGRMTPRVG